MEAKTRMYLLLLLVIPILAFGQVGINTTSPNASLDIQSSSIATPANTDGILIPKIDEYPLTNPTVAQDGLLVFATGNGSVTKGFYYWDNATTSWIPFSGATIEKIDDLTDGKSDNDGTNNGSSIFLGVNAGLNDDETNNHNVSVGPNSLRDNTSGSNNSAFGNEALIFNTTGYQNTALGQKAMNFNTNGFNNTAIGHKALRSSTSGSSNTVIGASAGENLTGDGNVVLGYFSGYNSNGSYNVFLGRLAGYSEAESNRLFIENSSSASPLIYGEFDNDFLRVNGELEVLQGVDASIKVLSNALQESSLKLFEAGDYGFEFEYDGSPDKLFLWSRTFAGNEGIRMTWLKDGKVGMNDTSPDARLDIEAINQATPLNTDGILIPRIDAFPSSNPGVNQNGMLVFLTSNNSFYYWNSSATSWRKISTNDRIDDLLDGKSDSDGSNNGSSIFLGVNAGFNDDSSHNRNTAIGYYSMYDNTIGDNNSAYGYQSLYNNTSGDYNVAIGNRALYTNSIGNQNTALGFEALEQNQGNYNTAIGYIALDSNTNANGNTAVGNQALSTNSSGEYNVSIGYRSMIDNSTGNNNVAVGFHALQNNTIGGGNIAIGRNASFNTVTGSSNTAIGYGASPAGSTFDNTTSLGAGASPNSPNQVRLGNASVSVIGGYASWSFFSDERLKTNIQENIVGLEFIKKLRPVSYNYDMDAIARFEKTPDSLRLRDAERLKAQEIQTGFIAQEVEAAAKAVGFDFHGIVKPYDSHGTYALRYAEFVVPLVKAMQEQQVIIESQEKEIDALRNEIEQIKLLLKNN